MLTLDERIEMSRKDMNKKALHEFMTIGWLHPKFRDLQQKPQIRRFGGLNEPFSLDQGANLIESLQEGFPMGK